MSRVAFAPPAAFARAGNGYRLLPFRFLRWDDGHVLLANDGGEHVFLDASTFADFVAGNLKPSSSTYLDLKARHMLTDSPSSVPIEMLAAQLRTRKSFMEGFTRLHLFVVTLRCDHSCRYCQVSRVTQERERFDMSRATAERALDLVFRSPARDLKIEFQGGEPLLNFERVRFVIERAEERAALEGRRIEFVVATNLAPLDDEMLEFLRAHHVLVSTSLDGPALLHDANRPRPGASSHALTLRGVERARAVLGHDRVAALMTTTDRSLAHPREIVDEYARLGFDSIFLRPVSPYGFAVRTGESSRYDARRFLAFYETALDHVIALNRRGVRIVEAYAQLLLRRMLTPFATGYVDLQSPSGAGIAAVAYDYDGDVYPSDEARMLAQMGDRSLRLGNVHADTYAALFGGSQLRRLVAASVAEALPGCCECAFVPFCGGDPIFHWATQGDPIGHRPTSAFCLRHMGLFRLLFERLRGGDEFVRDLFTSWATGTVPAATEPAACA